MILDFSPARYSTQNAVGTIISVRFDRPMDASTIQPQNIFVYGEQTGVHDGSVTYSAAIQTLSFIPANPFRTGEKVTVVLKQGVVSSSGTPIASSFQWSFFIRVARSLAVFKKDAEYFVQNGPQGIVLADFNNDNFLDVAVSHSNSDDVEILLNDSTFTLNSSQVIDVERQPRSLVAVDFNNDGFIDLVVANEATRTLSILLNEGQGKFSLKSNIDVTGTLLSFLIAGDFNGDGAVDLATINRNSNDVTVLLNLSDTLTELGSFPVGVSPRTGFAADFNNDGILDIVVANKTDSTFSLLNGNGDGTFQPQQVFPAGNGPHYISGGDFNGDNNIDIALTNRDEDTVWPYFNDGVGGFVLGNVIQVGREPRSLLIRDLDGDSDVDMMAGNFKASEMSYLLNTGFGAYVNDSTYSIGKSPRIILGGDTDNDGDLDLVISNWGKNTIEIFENLNPVGPPEAPSLISPGNGAFFNASSSPPKLEWLVPKDSDGDSLHFRIEIATDKNFSSVTVIESKSDVTGFSPVPPVAPGKDTVSYSFDTELQEGKYWWRVSAWDGSSYGATSFSRFFTVDKTPPSGALASSPVVSSSKDFRVTWSSGTDSGSGLSGIFDVMVKIDTDAWTVWKSNFPDTSAIYDGQHGHSYAFEAAAHDSAGNIEVFAQVAETTTQVDTIANDTAAPGPPVSLTAGGSNPSPWQTSPTFEINWVPPADLSGIALALYKVGSPPAANFDTTGSVSDGSSLRYGATQEDGQRFYMWFTDGQGNVDYRNRGSILLRYDNTPPEFHDLTIANPDFAPHWMNQAQTTLAGIVVRYNESHLRQITLEAAELNTTISLERVPSGDFSFEIGLNIQNKPDGLFELKVTLIDSAGNNSSSTTNIGLDTTPPTDTEASSPDTSTSETFTVSWTGTGSDNGGSGLSGIFDVRYQENGGRWIDFQQVQETSITFQGSQGRTYGFEVRGYDNVGNVEPFTGTAETVTTVDTGFVDASPPIILHQPQIVVDEGLDVTIQAQIQDNSQVAQAVFYYKRSGNDDFQAKQMSNAGGDVFEAMVSASEVSIYGINYYIQAWDGFHFSYFPESNWDTLPINVSVRISGINNEGLVKDTPQPGGEESKYYRMISIPLNLSNSNPAAVLEDDLGSYNSTNWRLFQYQSSSDSYIEYPNIKAFAPGIAGWLIVREPNKQIDSGTGTSVATNQPFEIILNQGWNDFGNPFTFPVDWSDVQIGPTTVDGVMGPYAFQGQWLLPNQVSTLLPWEGYSVYSQTSGVKLAIPPHQSSSIEPNQLAKSFSNSEWFIEIEALCEGASDGSNYLGISEDAANDWDHLDYLEPPYIAEFVSVRFPHNDWQGYKGDFTTDFRAPFFEGQVWPFEVKTNIQNSPVRLRFKNLTSLPLNYKVVLRDNTTFQEMDVGQLTEYEFLPDQNSLKRQFDLIIGTKNFIENSDQLEELQPESYFLSQNFPNPFNAGTSLYYQVAEPGKVSIKVLNILGQELQELVSEKQTPGTYRIHWDGTARNGHEMGSGVYLIKLEVGKFQQIRKVILIR